MAQEVRSMGVKWLFRRLFSVLVHPVLFWKEVRDGEAGVNAMKEYALPVIAMVQLCKFPVIGVPRTAMILTLVSFAVDVSVLYLVAGVLTRMIGTRSRATVSDRVMTVLSYALTPLWIVEPLFFTGRITGMLFAAAALVYAVMIIRAGLAAMFDDMGKNIDGLHAKSALVLVMASSASFLVMRGLIRLFTTF